MNPDAPVDPRSALEANLTALLLGELPHDQAAALHQKLAQDPELAALYERLKHTINWVRETISSPAAQAAAPLIPLRLEEHRRQNLLEHFKTVAPREFARPRRRRMPVIIQGAIAVAIVALLAAIAVPNFVAARRTSLGSFQAMTSLSREKEAAPSAPAIANSTKYFGGQDRNGRTERYASDGQARGKVAALPTPAPAAPRLPEPAGSAIVLPKATELADATAAADGLQSAQAGAATAVRTRGFFDDSPGRAGGTGGGGATGGRSGGNTPRDAVVAEGRPAEVASANFYFGETEARRAPKAGKPVKNDEPMLFYRESPPAAVVANHAGDTFDLEGAGKLLDRAEGARQAAPAEEAFARRYGLGVQPSTAKGVPELAAPAVPAPPVATPAPLYSVSGGALVAPVPSEPAPAAADTALETARAPLQSQALAIVNNRTAGDLAVAGRAYAPSRPPAETKRGAELLREPAAAASPTPALSAGLPSTASSRFNIAAYGGYAGTTQIADGERGRVPNLGDMPVAGALFRSDAKDGLKSHGESKVPTPQETAVNEAVLRQANVQLQPAQITPGPRAPETPPSVQERFAPAKAGEPLPAGTHSSWSDASKNASEAPVLGATLKGVTTTAKPDSDGRSVGFAANSLSVAGEAAAKSSVTDGHTVASAGNAKLAYSWDADGNRVPGSASSGAEGTPLPGSAPAVATDWFYRLNGDDVGAGGKAQVEEKVKSVDLAMKFEDVASGVEGLDGRRQIAKVQDDLLSPQRELLARRAMLGDKAERAAGQSRHSPATTRPEELKPQQSGWLQSADNYAGGATRAARPAPSSIVLPTAEGESGLALKDSSGAGQKSRAYSAAQANLGELGQTREIAAAPEVTRALHFRHTERNGRGEPEMAKKMPAATPAPAPQPEVQTSENSFSTFSLNVSDVSFKLAAASLEKGVMPEPVSVRSEEFLNSFEYRDPEPPPGVPVAFAWERAQYPFAQNRDLLRFSIKTAALGRQPGRALNLVLLLDNSGSMERADRVRIIREALRVLGGQLQPQDKFSVVTFSRTAHLWVDGVPGNQAPQVADEVSGLTPQGGTNLEEAMNLAYQTALRHYLANGINRVVLLTDGAANLGNVDPESLKQKVEANRKQGVALDCFGIGWEGYNDDLLEVLSRNGDGRYGFVNTPEEAATEFAGQLAGALKVAASDVKVQVEFNPARVTAYRQIGYAKHQLTKEQFRDNTVDAAEIGAAESGNALYVVAVNPAGDGPLATVRVRYKVPGTTDYHEHAWSVPYTGNAVALEQSSPAMRLAATASAFSEWLVSSPYSAEVTPDRLLGYLSGVPEVYGADARPKKLEWMIRQAKSIAGK